MNQPYPPHRPQPPKTYPGQARQYDPRPQSSAPQSAVGPQWAPMGATPTAIPSRKRRRWPWVVAGVVVLLLVLSAIGGGNKPAPATPTAPTWKSAAPTASAPAQAAPQQAEEAAEAAPAGPKTSFGDGTWVVGEDVVAGTYKSAGAKEGVFELCSVTTHSDENADSDTVLDWKTANANEPIRLRVSGKVKSVKAAGCGDFVKVD